MKKSHSKSKLHDTVRDAFKKFQDKRGLKTQSIWRKRGPKIRGLLDEEWM